MKLSILLIVLGAFASIANAKEETITSAEFSSSTYFNSTKESFPEQGTGLNSIVKLKHFSDSQKGRWQNRIKSDFFYSLDEDANYIHVTELFTQIKTSDVHFTLGRKKHVWSETDDLWRLGLWQPRFNWNKLDAETDGLTGIYVQSSNPQFNWTLFVSPIYIPDIGPHFEMREHQFYSANPWFHAPYEYLLAPNGKQKLIEYAIDKPSVEKVITQFSSAMQLKWQHPKEHFIALSLGFKPINQFLYTSRIELPVSIQPNNIRATIGVRTLYHQIATAETSVKFSKLCRVMVSETLERPIQEKPDDRLLTQQIDDAALFQLGLQCYSDESTVPSSYYVSYLNLQGGLAPDRSDLLGQGLGDLVEGESRFESRWQYFNAFKVGYEKPFYRVKNRIFNIRSELIYDQKQRAMAFNSSVGLRWNQFWDFSVKAQVLGQLDTQEAAIENSLLREYKANDNFQAGMNYVF